MSEATPEVRTDATSEQQEAPVTTPVAAPAAPTAAKPAGKMLKNKTTIATIAAVVIVAVLIVLASLSVGSGALSKLFSRDEVVASVDGSDILRSELDNRLRQVRGPEAPGTPDAAEEQQALDDLVNMRLILNVAERSNISVSEEEVAAELASLVQTFGDQAKLDAQLAAVGISQEQLSENIRQELTIRKVVDANTESEQVAVTDEEVRAYYDSNNIANMPEAPSYEELVPFIKDRLVQEKTGAILNEYLAKLKGEAEVELLLQ